VQGVGFRQFIARSARDLNVTGCVGNRAGGSVETVVAGTSEAVRLMLERARRGPAHATVTEIVVADGGANCESFETLPTV
jgi:acylphosphatase